MNRIHDCIRIDISANSLEAFAYPVKSYPSKTVKKSEFVELLKDAGVLSGYLDEQIVFFLSNWKKGLIKGPMVVAHGYPAVSGKSKVYCRIHPPHRDGRNPVELLPLFVKKGEPVIRVTGGEGRKAGRDVRGRDLLPDDSQDEAEIKPGPGLVVEGNVWRARRTGFLEQTEGQISVTKKLIHCRDLPVAEYSWDDSALIKGDIVAGTSLSVVGDLEIEGNVLSGVAIEATGTVTVNGLVLGRGSRVDAGGSIRVKKIIEATLITAQDIIIQESSTNASLRAYGRVLADQSGCIVIGGRIQAVEGAFFYELGSESGEIIQVQVGEPNWIVEEAQELEKEANRWRGHYETLFNKFRAKYSTLLDDRKLIHKLPDEKRERYEEEREAVSLEQRRVDSKISDIRSRQAMLTSAHVRDEDAVIRIEKVAYKGSGLSIRSKSYPIPEEGLREVALSLPSGGGKVIAIPKMIYDSSRDIELEA